MRAIFLFMLVLFALTPGGLDAQTPPVVVVQAATPGPAASAPVVAAKTAASPQTTLKLLQEMKAANKDTIEKQTATLQLLEELEKSAEQLKIFASRS
jgi:hypothetical protein